MVQHDGAEAFADVDGGGETGGGLLFQAAKDDGSRARSGAAGLISRRWAGSVN